MCERPLLRLVIFLAVKEIFDMFILYITRIVKDFMSENMKCTAGYNWVLFNLISDEGDVGFQNHAKEGLRVYKIDFPCYFALKFLYLVNYGGIKLGCCCFGIRFSQRLVSIISACFLLYSSLVNVS